MGICTPTPLGKVNPFTVMVSEHSRLILHMHTRKCSNDLEQVGDECINHAGAAQGYTQV